MKAKLWEVGSDFNTVFNSFDHFEAWHSTALFLASGRSPIVLLKELIGEKVLYYPDYFCWDVIGFWKSQGINTQSYRVFFSEDKIQVDYSTVPVNGVVLAVNFFGVDDGMQWKNFKRDNDILLIEDHSHSPVSEWAKSSIADFAFSSLRKTLPIPDGCIFWSPNYSKIPSVSMQQFNSELKIKAMKLKSDYFEGEEVNKSDFLELFTAGEHLLVNSTPQLISDYSYQKILHGYPVEYNSIRKRNYQAFIMRLSANTLGKVELLQFPGIAIPFGAVLKCSDLEIRTRLRSYLISNKVYCPVHWPQLNEYVSEESFSLSEQLITIPIDQRYSSKDVGLVAELINRFFDNE